MTQVLDGMWQGLLTLHKIILWLENVSVTGPNPCWDQTCVNSSAGTNATDSEWIVHPINNGFILDRIRISSPLVGTWKLSPNAGALGVGPNQGDISWWSNQLVM